MPFHSVETEDEACDLIVLHCHQKPLRHPGGEVKTEYAVTRTWADDDILEAMDSAARQFGLQPRNG